MQPNTLIAGKRSRAEKDNMIPLINIVFLLLIFFMVAGQMKQPQAENLALPSTELGAAAESDSLQLEYTRNEQLFLLGHALTLHAFTAQLAKGEYSTNRFRLRVDKALTAEQLDKLLDIFREHNITQVHLATEQPSSEQVSL